MAKGKRKKHRKGGKITFGRTMAAGGEFTSSVGVVISWIIGILMALTGIYLILAGSFGRFDIFDSGQCKSTNPVTCPNSKGVCGSSCARDSDGMCYYNDPCGVKSESSCKSDSSCTYSSTGTYSTGVRVMYIIGGLLTILFGVILLVPWSCSQKQKHGSLCRWVGNNQRRRCGFWT